MEIIEIFRVPQYGLFFRYVDLKKIHWGLITLCFGEARSMRDIVPFQIIFPAGRSEPLLAFSPSGRIFKGNIFNSGFDSRLCRVSLVGSIVKTKKGKKVFRNYLIIGAKVIISIYGDTYLMSRQKLKGVDWAPM